MTIKRRLFWLAVERDPFLDRGYGLHFLWRPRSDLTGDGFMVACSWFVDLSFRLPSIRWARGRLSFEIGSTKPTQEPRPDHPNCRCTVIEREVEP